MKECLWAICDKETEVSVDKGQDDESLSGLKLRRSKEKEEEIQTLLPS